MSEVRCYSKRISTRIQNLTSDFFLMCQSVNGDVDAETCVVFSGEAFVFPIVIPFAAVIFVGIKHSDAMIYINSAQVIVNDVVAPTIVFVVGGGATIE